MAYGPRRTAEEMHDLARRMRALRAEGLTVTAAAETLGIDVWTAKELPRLPASSASRAELVAAAQPWRQNHWSAKDVS